MQPKNPFRSFNLTGLKYKYGVKNMKKIKIAQIGAGHDHADASITTLKRNSDIFELVGYAIVPEDEKNPYGYEMHKNAYDGVPLLTVEEILNYPELDAVCIETEDRALTKYALSAAEKGLAIQMDKPGGIDDEEYDRLIELVKEKKLVFHVGYMYRYNEAVMKVKEDIKSGKLGEIYAVEAQMNCYHAPIKRNWLIDYPGGMMYFLGCHLVDLVYGICGMPEEIIPLSTSIGSEGVTAEDFGMAVFKYKNGVSFVKSTAVELGGFERRQIVICGTKGTVEIRPTEHAVTDRADLFSAQTTGVRETYSYDWCAKGEYHDTEVVGRYDAMFRAFAEYVNGEKENPYDYEYERTVHKLVLKACGK